MMYEEKGHNKITSELIHTIPNRARFRVLGLKFLSKYKLELAKRFMAIKGIKSITVNATTQSILLIYDGKKYDLLDLQDLVDGIVGEYSLLALQEYKNSNKKELGFPDGRFDYCDIMLEKSQLGFAYLVNVGYRRVDDFLYSRKNA